MNEFEKYITTWGLTPDGASIKTPSSHLLPVRYNNKPIPTTLVPLSRWFRSLESAKTQHGGILNQAALIAQALLNDPQEQVVLHGDIHHGNILDFGEHGWLAIDPKGLIGERGFDYANIFCNPDKEIALKITHLTQHSIF